MTVRDGPNCPGCGVPNYEGLCPHCRGDQDAYERELVPPFATSRPAIGDDPNMEDDPDFDLRMAIDDARLSRDFR